MHAAHQHRFQSLRVNHRFYSAGFTLIEVLVILIIVSIITMIAVLAFGHFGRGRREKIVVGQFARVITAAQQQAILTPAVLGLTIKPGGYEFYQFTASLNTAGNWAPLKQDVLSNRAAFRHLFHVTVKKVQAFSLSESSHKTPVILFLPTGYITPFTVLLKGSAGAFQVTVKNNGNINIKQSKS